MQHHWSGDGASLEMRNATGLHARSPPGRCCRALDFARQTPHGKAPTLPGSRSGIPPHGGGRNTMWAILTSPRRRAASLSSLVSITTLGSLSEPSATIHQSVKPKRLRIQTAVDAAVLTAALQEAFYRLLPGPTGGKANAFSAPSGVRNHRTRRLARWRVPIMAGASGDPSMQSSTLPARRTGTEPGRAADTGHVPARGVTRRSRHRVCAPSTAL